MFSFCGCGRVVKDDSDQEHKPIAQPAKRSVTAAAQTRSGGGGSQTQTSGQHLRVPSTAGSSASAGPATPATALSGGRNSGLENLNIHSSFWASKVEGRIIGSALNDFGRRQLLVVTDASSIAEMKAQGIYLLPDVVTCLFQSGALCESGRYRYDGATHNGNGATIKAAHLHNGTTVHSLNDVPPTAHRLYLVIELSASPSHGAPEQAQAQSSAAIDANISLHSQPIAKVATPAPRSKGFADPDLRGKNLTPAELLRAVNIQRPSMLRGAETGKAAAELDSTISIVGGGASGLSVAFFLLENHLVPAKNITIYEKLNETGGKIHSFQIDGRWYEKGAAHLLNFYDTTFWLMHHFKLPIEVVQHYTLTGYSFSDVMKLILEAAPMGLELLYYIHLIEDSQFDQFYATASFRDVAGNSELRLSLDEFLKKHHLETLKSFLDMMAYTLTSITGDALPMGIFLKLFPPTSIKSFLEYNLVDYIHLKPFFPNVEPPGYFAPEGYQSLMKAMTKELKAQGVNFVYEHTVVKVDTTDSKRPKLTLDHHGLRLESSSDFVVFATMYTSTDANFNPIFIEGLPCLPTLRRAAKDVANPAILKYHVRSSNSKELGDYLFTNSTGKVNTPYAVYNFAPETNILATLSVVTPGMWTDGAANEEMKKKIQNDLEKGGFGTITLLDPKEDNGYLCKVQPAPNVQLVQSGYYNKLEGWQGQSNIFYSNIHYTFSYSGLVMQYGREVAQLMCQQLRGPCQSAAKQVY